MTMSFEEYLLILRHDFMSFIERSFYELNPRTRLVGGPHIEVMASRIEAVRRGNIKRLIVALPPRHLKSHCASIAFVAWYLGHHPSNHVICVSYGQDLADKLARDCRTVIQSPWYKSLFPTRLADRLAVHDFTTTLLGTRMATSVGGVLTGRGADLIVIDDALKPDEALSESGRKAVNGWYDNTLLSRLNDKTNGRIVIIMQRLHQEDLVGHVLEQEPWEVLSFPAIAEQEEHFLIESQLGSRWFKRKAGEALHPERETLASLAAIRLRMGDYNFSAQYQQNPIPLGGAMVKTEWLRYHEPSELPEPLTIVQSWDTANKTTELADYSVCTTWGRWNGQVYLLDVFRARLNYPDLKRKVKELARRFNARVILIEDKASGTQLIQDLQAEHVRGITAYVPVSGTDKIMRLHTQTHWFENGKVLLPRDAPWIKEYVKELTGFPGTKHDDQVDSTTQALDYMRAQDPLEIWRRLGISDAEFRARYEC